MSRILVVAPHPDDDAIGCGGTIARCAEGAVNVHVVYVTDGAASHPRSQRFPAASLRAMREREAIAGLRALGVRAAPTFLRVPDGRVSGLPAERREAVVRSLQDVVRATACDAVFAPWPGEPHPDHAASAMLVADALRGIQASPALVWYAVWLDIFGGPMDRPRAGAPYLDVWLSDEERAMKRAAIMAHASQTTRLIDDDPEGFCASAAMLERWLQPVERFYARTEADLDEVSRALGLGTLAA